MRIIDILDRLEDRVTETIKSWDSGESIPSLEFDIELIEKDIELIRNLIREQQKKREV